MVLASEFLPPAAVASMAEPTESMAGADSFATLGGCFHGGGGGQLLRRGGSGHHATTKDLMRQNRSRSQAPSLISRGLL